MASSEDAAWLLLLELGLAWLLPMDLVHVFLVFTLRVFLLLLFSGQQKDQLHGGGTGRLQVRGSCLARIASLNLVLLVLTFRGCCC